MNNTIIEYSTINTEEMTDTLYYYLKNHDIELNEKYEELYNCLQWIKAAAQNPFNDGMFYTTLEVLQTISELLKQDNLI